jgi:hypothetical protein
MSNFSDMHNAEGHHGQSRHHGNDRNDLFSIGLGNNVTETGACYCGSRPVQGVDVHVLIVSVLQVVFRDPIPAGTWVRWALEINDHAEETCSLPTKRKRVGISLLEQSLSMEIRSQIRNSQVKLVNTTASVPSIHEDSYQMSCVRHEDYDQSNCTQSKRDVYIRQQAVQDSGISSSK